jgi:hypothetical protein
MRDEQKAQYILAQLKTCGNVQPISHPDPLCCVLMMGEQIIIILHQTAYPLGILHK